MIVKITWLRASWFDGPRVPDIDDPLFSHEFIISGALDIMHAMGRMSWEQKEKALHGFYHGMRGTCSRWVKEEDRSLH